MKYSKTFKWSVTGVCLALALLMGWWVRPRAAGGKVASSEGTVKRKDLSQRVTITGQVWPKRRLDVKPRFAGYVVKLYVKVGDQLKVGDPIVTFSPSLGNGETNFPLRAGFAGTVTQVQRAEGEYLLDSGDQNLVARVEDLSELSILSTVPELDVAKVKVGQEADVRVSSLVGEDFKAVIREIGLSARDKDRWSSSSTEFQLKAQIKTKDPRLLPGMSAVMDIITDKRSNVLTLPHEFIAQEDGKYFVTTLAGEKRVVKLGLQTDEAAEILEGLNEGDRVKPVDFLSLTGMDN